MILNGTSTAPTSTFPYVSIGPIDFSQLNFVKTTQTDYYYGYPDASATQEVLLSQVTQTYDPTTAFLTIGGLMFAFLFLLGWGIGKIRRMGK